MKKYFKKNLLKLCTLATVLCTTASVGAVMASAEENTETTGKSLSEISYTMMNGASIRTDGTGIRFSALLSQDDYDGLTVQYGEDLEFGTFIMAAKYLDSKSGGAFTEEQFFGDYDNDDATTSIYTWDGATVTEDRVQILQMESSAYLDTKENAIRVNGSVARVYDNNLDMDYIGVCYIKAGTEYKLASLNNNVRNVVYVSQLAVAKSESADFVSAGQAVIDHYTTLADAVTSVNYTVNTYIHNYETGAVEYGEPQEYSAELNESISLSEIASTITATDGTYNYVASRSTTSGVAYIGDKLTLDLYYHKKADGVLYDFYDTEEATSFYYFDTYGIAEDFDGEECVNFDRQESAWGTLKFTNTDIDNSFSVSESAYMYIWAYVKTPTSDTVGETRFTYHYYNGTDWSSNKYECIDINKWNYLAIPIKSNSPNLAGIQFSFQRLPSGGSWQAIGETADEALYIREIGIIEKSETVDFTKGVSDSSSMMSVFSSSNATLLPNHDTNYTYNGATGSLRIVSAERYPKIYFTQEFVEWFNEKGKTIKFYVSYDAMSTSTNKFVRMQHATSSNSHFNNAVYKDISNANTWYTPKVTLTKTSLTNSELTTTHGLQFNKNSASHINIYLHWVITYNA